MTHRETVAARKTRRFENSTYWGRPVPGFGDPHAQVLVVGLAPAAHGANRTGRMFTGDRSGDWLYAALNRFGFASQADSSGRDDGMRLVDCFISAAVRCAPPDNKPNRREFETCRPFLVQDIHRLQGVRVVVALGHLAFRHTLMALGESGVDIPRPRPTFSHGVQQQLNGTLTLIASYHPSQQNTFTGRLTRPMFHQIFRRARQAVDRART